MEDSVGQYPWMRICQAANPNHFKAAFDVLIKAQAFDILKRSPKTGTTMLEHLAAYGLNVEKLDHVMKFIVRSKITLS